MAQPADGQQPTDGEQPTDGARRLLGVLLGRDPQLLPRDEAAWRTLASDAAAVNAEGLLHAAVRRAGESAAPPADLRDHLRRAHAAVAAKNLELDAEAARVLAAFAAAGVVAAPMKGAALFRERVVRDLGTRPTTDLDVATRPPDRRAALEVLRDLGYTPSRTERSWKHLTPMRRADLAVELHEIAWWSGRTRRTFGAEHLAVDDVPTRLGRLWALQVHHLVLGSPPDAALLVRTLADVASFAELARSSDALVRAATAAAAEAGLEREVAACDVIVADACGAERVLRTLPLDPALAQDILAPLHERRPVDVRVNVLAHFLRTVHRQPLAISAATLATLLAAPVTGDGTRARWSRARRPLELALRLGMSLPRALRDLARR